MNALVTGAAGFIASTLSARLLERGARVTGIDCFTDYYPRFIKEANLAPLVADPNFTFVEAGLQSANLPKLLDGVTHVFHLAAQAGVRKSWGKDFQTYTVNNIEATQALLEACVDRPIERLVYASSSSVYGDDVELPFREMSVLRPVSPYGVSKLAAEQLCYLYFVNHGVPTVSLRYFTVYGPKQRPDMGFHKFLKAVIRGEAIGVYGDGDQTRDFTFVADAVTATADAAAKGVPGRVYNIGGGSRVSVNEVLDLIGTVTGMPVTINREAKQKGDMRNTYADTSLARAEMGFAPSVTLADGLRAEFEWLQRSPAILAL